MRKFTEPDIFRFPNRDEKCIRDGVKKEIEKKERERKHEDE